MDATLAEASVDELFQVLIQKLLGGDPYDPSAIESYVARIQTISLCSTARRVAPSLPQGSFDPNALALDDYSDAICRGASAEDDIFDVIPMAVFDLGFTASDSGLEQGISYDEIAQDYNGYNSNSSLFTNTGSDWTMQPDPGQVAGTSNAPFPNPTPNFSGGPLTNASYPPLPQPAPNPTAGPSNVLPPNTTTNLIAEQTPLASLNKALTTAVGAKEAQRNFPKPVNKGLPKLILDLDVSRIKNMDTSYFLDYGNLKRRVPTPIPEDPATLPETAGSAYGTLVGLYRETIPSSASTVALPIMQLYRMLQLVDARIFIGLPSADEVAKEDFSPTPRQQEELECMAEFGNAIMKLTAESFENPNFYPDLAQAIAEKKYDVVCEVARKLLAAHLHLHIVRVQIDREGGFSHWTSLFPQDWELSQMYTVLKNCLVHVLTDGRLPQGWDNPLPNIGRYRGLRELSSSEFASGESNILFIHDSTHIFVMNAKKVLRWFIDKGCFAEINLQSIPTNGELEGANLPEMWKNTAPLTSGIMSAVAAAQTTYLQALVDNHGRCIINDDLSSGLQWVRKLAPHLRFYMKGMNWHGEVTTQSFWFRELMAAIERTVFRQWRADQNRTPASLKFTDVSSSAGYSHHPRAAKRRRQEEPTEDEQ